MSFTVNRSQSSLYISGTYFDPHFASEFESLLIVQVSYNTELIVQRVDMLGKPEYIWATWSRYNLRVGWLLSCCARNYDAKGNRHKQWQSSAGCHGYVVGGWSRHTFTTWHKNVPITDWRSVSTINKARGRGEQVWKWVTQHFIIDICVYIFITLGRQGTVLTSGEAPQLWLSPPAVLFFYVRQRELVSHWLPPTLLNTAEEY